MNLIHNELIYINNINVLHVFVNSDIKCNDNTYIFVLNITLLFCIFKTIYINFIFIIDK